MVLLAKEQRADVDTLIRTMSAAAWGMEAILDPLVAETMAPLREIAAPAPAPSVAIEEQEAEISSQKDVPHNNAPQSDVPQNDAPSEPDLTDSELDELYPRPDEEPTRQESGSTVQEVTNASRRDSSGQGVFLGDLNKRIIASDEVTLVVTRFLRQQHPDVRSVTVSEITNITFIGAWVYRTVATAAGVLSNATGSPKHFDVEVLVGKNGSVVGVNGQRWRGNFGVRQALRSND
ncbi:MAG: hypothetical protein QGI88_14730 [SAR202 cluster bacterium]|nr:hypothetical protein [SAR202 cluster bacterium]